MILVERDDPIAVVLLNRPEALNALSDELMDALVSALQELDADPKVRCLVLGGSERAFAAGADIAELAMSCDLIVASETAVFGQPEPGLGIMPGAGGTQRLTRAVGKSLAMDMILSGRRLSAREALQAGLVARVVAKEAWLEEAKRVARDIAGKGPVATRLAKEAVDRAFQGPLSIGLDYERRALYLAFASEDAKEGLTAFVEKRKPDFKGR